MAGTVPHRAQFFGVAANFMRRILVDHARAAEKRGSGGQRLSLTEADCLLEQKDVDLIALDEAMNDLAELDRQQCRVVELRFFAGLTIEETAEVIGISPMTTPTKAKAEQWQRCWISASPSCCHLNWPRKR